MVDNTAKKIEAAEWLEVFIKNDLPKEKSISYNKLVKKLMISILHFVTHILRNVHIKVSCH